MQTAHSPYFDRKLSFEPFLFFKFELLYSCFENPLNTGSLLYLNPTIFANYFALLFRNVKVVRDPVTNRSKNIGFISFTNKPVS